MKRFSDAATKYSNAQNLWSKNIFFTFFPKKTGNVFSSFILVPKRSSKNFFLLLRGRKDYSKLVLNSEAADPKDLFRSSLFLKILQTFFFFASLLLFFFAKMSNFLFLPLDIDTWNVLSVKETVIIWRFNVFNGPKALFTRGQCIAKISRCVFLLSMELSVTRLFGKIWPVLATF